MGASDRTGAGWVLMALAVGAGWWYWQLLPGERRKVLGGKNDIGTGGASGGGGATGLYDPHDQPLPPGYQGPPAAFVPFDAGARLAALGVLA